MERVGEGHADLRHAVALQKYVAADLLPPLQDADRQGGRATDHEPERSAANRQCGLSLRRSRIPGGDQPAVDGGHRHEEGQLPAGDRLPDGPGVELRVDRHPGTGPRAQVSTLMMP